MQPTALRARQRCRAPRRVRALCSHQITDQAAAPAPTPACPSHANAPPGYGDVDPKLWPFYMVAGLSPQNPLLEGLKQSGCGECACMHAQRAAAACDLASSQPVPRMQAAPACMRLAHAPLHVLRMRLMPPCPPTPHAGSCLEIVCEGPKCRSAQPLQALITDQCAQGCTPMQVGSGRMHAYCMHVLQHACIRPCTRRPQPPPGQPARLWL